MSLIALISLKGGGTGTPPEGYTWLNNAEIDFDGNSLTAGQGATAGMDYPSQLIALLTTLGITGISWNNFGVGGQTTAAMASDAASQVDTQITSGVQNILFAWEIGNDIYFNGNVSTAQTAFANYCTARRAAGWKVIVFTLTPRNQSSSFGDSISAYNAKLTSANTWLRANWTSFADGIVDIAADSRMDDYTDSTYFSDGIHYTNAGYGVAAELGQTVLLSLAH